MPQSPVLLSVDFDFFVPEDPTYSMLVGGFSGDAWARVEACASSSGQNLREMIRVSTADFHPLKMKAVLEEAGWTFSPDCKVLYAEDHGWAFRVFSHYPETRIVNFGVHHDLGYDSLGRMASGWFSNEYNCSNWAALALVLDRFSSRQYAQIFPGGLDRPRWYVDDGMWWNGLDMIQSRLQFHAFSYDLLPTLAGEVQTIFVARSGAWVPPWCDQDFEDFIRSWGLPSTDAGAAEGFRRSCEPREPREPSE